MRLGLHVQDNQSLDLAVDYCARVKPAVMKWLAPEPEVLRRCRAASPNTKHISRIVWQPQTPGAYPDFVARTMARAEALGRLIDYHEAYNEHIPTEASTGDIRDFARLEVGFAKKLNEKGFGALIGGFSTGTLDGGKIDGFKVAFDYMQAVGPERCALHFHEYAGGYAGHFIKTPDGLNQWPDGGQWTGYSRDPRVWDDPKLRGWLLLRYRDLWPQLLARGWDKVRFFVTESGLDNVNKNPGGKKGWRELVGTEWERVPGMGDFAQQMRWYAWQMSQDPYVWGAVDYGFGTRDHSWDSFDLSQDRAMLERFIAAQVTIPLAGTTAPPVAVPPPVVVPPVVTPPPGPVAVPLRVEPRIQVLPGDNWYAVSRRALDTPNATAAHVAALKAANPEAAAGGLKPWAWLRSPWHKAVPL